MSEATQTDAEQTSTVKELEFEGHKFKVDTDLLDDVEAFGLINKIENQNQITAIVPLMNYLIGVKPFAEMKQYFVDKDAEENKDKKGYHPRMRSKKLAEIYQVIIANFDPKD